MSEWLTGSAVRGIRAETETRYLGDGVMPCGYVLALLDDHKRLVGLVKELTEGYDAEFPTFSIIEARACLKAQEK